MNVPTPLNRVHQGESICQVAHSLLGMFHFHVMETLCIYLLLMEPLTIDLSTTRLYVTTSRVRWGNIGRIFE